jgi:hypothetical protein
MIAVQLLKQQPWRFHEGATVYVRGWPVDETGRVVGTIQPTRSGFPHYLVVDGGGGEWRVPQIHLSSKPIYERE